MGRLCLILSLLLLASPAFAATALVCDPAKFGARADGKTKDTKAIQAAIDDCAAKGGGTVTLTKGTYVSAPIILKSNVTLDVAAGATLLGSPDHADYPQATVFRAPGRAGADHARSMRTTSPSPARARSTAMAKAGGTMPTAKRPTG